ncbi:hypothetical protein BJX63DRAFT_40283 [Aspergillus granulosus]|uniref:Uncharacterized protein n=1 Tax=Aspergillus granulosus TaxID=176169 RepID=A0ABR4GZ39_9EURO
MSRPLKRRTRTRRVSAETEWEGEGRKITKCRPRHRSSVRPSQGGAWRLGIRPALANEKAECRLFAYFSGAWDGEERRGNAGPKTGGRLVFHSRSRKGARLGVAALSLSLSDCERGKGNIPDRSAPFAHRYSDSTHGFP